MRRIYRAAKSAVVICLVFMMTVDTANACRLFQWLFAHRGTCTTSCAADMGVTLAEPSPVVESSNCCVEPVEVVGQPVMADYVDFPVEGSEIYAPAYEVMSEEVIMDASPVDLAPSDTIMAPAISSDEAPVPTPAEPEVADPVPSAPSESVISDPEPADPEPADVPAAEAEENPLEDPAEPAGDDLFSDPAPADEPARVDDFTPVDPQPAGDEAGPAGDDLGGDLFDDAPADTTPAEEPAGDLFDAAPADSAGGDDLFDAAPADDGGAGDLFDAAPADDGGSDLFDAAPADDAGGDDLFDAGGGDDSGDLDDLFGQRQSVPNGMRVWTDNTGNYQTVGRLAVIAKSHVRLLKANGRYSTVPLARLSEADLDYVMAVALKITQSQRLASR